MRGWEAKPKHGIPAKQQGIPAIGCGYTRLILVVSGRRDTLSLLAKVRSRCVHKGRGFLTLLVFAWLNVVLQPCAMAMANAIVCPDCPPTHIDEQISDATMEGHGHAMTMPEGPGGHHGAVEHDMGSAGELCAGELIDCVNLEDVNQTARQEHSTPEPGLVWIVPASEQCQCTYDRSASSFCIGDHVRLAGAFPPLNILYCVYLD